MVEVQKEKKVLMISYIFPPLGSGANQRTPRFVKYLGHFGWTPIILTVKDGYYRFKDDYFLSLVPSNVKLFRAFSLEPLRFEDFVRSKKSAMKSMKSNLSGKKTISIATDSNPRRSLSLKDRKSLLKVFYSGMIGFYLFLTKIFNKYLSYPDEKIGWIPFAVWMGIRIIHKEKPSVIWANADRYSGLVVGWILKKLTGKKLVINLSDPWTLSAYYKYNSESIIGKIDSAFERNIIQKADSVIFATKYMHLDYKKKYPEEAIKFRTILNGYDPEEYINNIPLTTSKFILTHNGTLHNFRSPQFSSLEAQIKAVNPIPEHLSIFIDNWSIQKAFFTGNTG